MRAPFFFLCLLLVLSGCTRVRTSSVSAGRDLPSRTSDTEDPSPLTADLETPSEVDELVQTVLTGLEQEKRLIEAGHPQEARLHLRGLLNRLEDSGYELSADPRLELAYHEVLGELLTLEVREFADPTGFPSAGVELSPLDEIGSVNLQDFDIDPLLEAVAADDVQRQELSFPLELNENVLRAIQYYQGPGRRFMESGLSRSGKYLNLFRRIFAEENIPLDLVYMAHVESLFQPRAYSRARARGIWQFMAGTGRLYGLTVNWWLDERLDVEKSTRAAARHLRDLFDEFQDWLLVLAAYNAGPGRVRRNLRRYEEMDFWTMSGRRLLPRETRNHVPSILAAILIFRNPQLYGFDVDPEPELAFDVVTVSYQVDLSVLAEELGVPVADLRGLNPALQRDVTPFSQAGFELKSPLGTGPRLQQILAELPEDKRLKMRHHSVRSGETLSKIASNYGTSVSAIAEVNRIRNIHRLRLGQDLIIPVSGSPSAKSSASSEAGASGDSHIVRRGDSLSRIARIHGVSVRQLATLNNLKPTDTIYPGQRLRVRSPAPAEQTSRQ